MLSSDPADGAVEIDRLPVFRIRMDRRLLPIDVHRGHLTVSSGVRNAFLFSSFDPVDQILEIRPAADPLDPSVQYRLRVNDIRDLDLNPMLEPWEITFWTSEQAQAPPAPPQSSFAEVEAIFARCAQAGCHSSEEPPLGLDLSTPAAIRLNTVGLVAEQARVGTQGDRSWPGAGALSGLSRIDVVGGLGRPDRSYLLYKVLGDPHIVGDPMPPPSEERLTLAELRTLARWIRAGAPTD